MKAATMFLSVADQYRGNNNFEYDLIDIVRQAVTEKGRIVQKAVTAAYRAGNPDAVEALSEQFLNLILLQDELLGTRPEFRLGTWINRARSLGKTEEEKDLYEWNARVQITTWGNREAADNGLLDYAHREWNGLLKDYYYMRWKRYFDRLKQVMQGENPAPIDFYALEESWITQHNPYSSEAQGDAIDTAKKVFEQAGI